MSEELRERKIGVTGANGFIGSAVRRTLLERGARVTGFFGEIPEAPFAADLFPSITADVCDEEAVSRFVLDQHTIIHLAGPPSVAASFADPPECVRVHVGGTACVMAKAVQAKTHRFVYVSSAEVYGNPQTEYVDEDHSLEARSPYAAAKIGAEKLVEASRLAYGLETVILRPFSVYGPGAAAGSVLSRIVQLAKMNQPIVLNDLAPVRDYSYVDDVARAIVIACETPASGRSFNIGTMRGTSVRGLAECVLQVLGTSLPITQSCTGKNNRPPDAEILHLVANNTRASNQLPWSPALPLEAGLRVMLSKN